MACQCTHRSLPAQAITKCPVPSVSVTKFQPATNRCHRNSSAINRCHRVTNVHPTVHATALQPTRPSTRVPRDGRSLSPSQDMPQPTRALHKQNSCWVSTPCAPTVPHGARSILTHAGPRPPLPGCVKHPGPARCSAPGHYDGPRAAQRQGTLGACLHCPPSRGGPFALGATVPICPPRTQPRHHVRMAQRSAKAK